MRKYLAVVEFLNGHIQDVEFYSNHRANSRSNKEDALEEIRRKFGWKTYETANVLNTYLA